MQRFLTLDKIIFLYFICGFNTQNIILKEKLMIFICLI